MISLDYKANSPLHEQISEKIRELIISGLLESDEKLPSVRELSVSLTVNPNTVQRAYKELEADGYIYSVLGKGNFVSAVKVKDEKRIAFLKEQVVSSVRELSYLGETKEEIEKIISDIYKTKEGDTK